MFPTSKFPWNIAANKAWIGLVYNQANRTWVWSEASASSSGAYQNWVGGVQPTGANSKFCAKAVRGSFAWTSEVCSSTTADYICEKGKVCLVEDLLVENVEMQNVRHKTGLACQRPRQLSSNRANLWRFWNLPESAWSYLQHGSVLVQTLEIISRKSRSSCGDKVILQWFSGFHDL